MPNLETPEEQTSSNPSIIPAKKNLESGQRAKLPATPEDSDDCMDLPTYVSLIAEQSKTFTNIRSTQNPILPEDKDGVKEASEDMKGPELNLINVTVEPHDVDLNSEEVLSPNHGSLHESSSGEKSPAHHETKDVIGLCEATDDISENNEEESDIAMPLNHSMDDDSEDVHLSSRSTAYAPPAAPSFPGDLKRDTTHRGGLVGSKIMKRSSSVISDSGIESEPSSVAWPLDAVLRARPPLDFSSEREIPQQMACRHPVHLSSMEGLQMASNGSLPSGGIQASLTSISSLPYEEDQQQRQLSKLTKSVSAPQISSPEDAEDDHVLLHQDADTKTSVQHQDVSCKHNSTYSNLDSEQSESSLLDASSMTNLGQILTESVCSEKSSPSQHLSEAHGALSVLSGVTEVLLFHESAEGTRVKESTVVGSQEENMNHQTHVSGVSAVDWEAAPCSCGNKPCEHQAASDQGRINSEDGCQKFLHSKLLDVEEQELSETQHASATQRPSDLTVLTATDVPSPVDLSGISFSEKEPLEGQTKSSKIPSSGLAFMNKKMVEVVNMSVSCAPTCLPFSSALRDSPSISGMSARQATSPITHQPLGSFGIISSSSLNLLNMDDETNERMLK